MYNSIVMFINYDPNLKCSIFTVFDLVDKIVIDSHKYIDDIDVIHATRSKMISKDIQILQKSLPAGIWVKTFESRMVNIY